MADEVDAIIEELDDWRGSLLSELRRWIKEAEPDIVEEAKWKKKSQPNGVPVWSRDGIICTGESYKDKVKLTFAQGASLDDPDGLFNASLDAGTRRAIDLFEGDSVKKGAFKTLVQSAAKHNAG